MFISYKTSTKISFIHILYHKRCRGDTVGSNLTLAVKVRQGVTLLVICEHTFSVTSEPVVTTAAAFFRFQYPQVAFSNKIVQAFGDAFCTCFVWGAVPEAAVCF